MPIGYIVGTIVAVCIIISGCVVFLYAKKNDRKQLGRWAGWAIIAGIAALISAVINYYLFN